MEFTCNSDEKCHSTSSIHIHYFPEILPHLFCRSILKVAVTLVFTAVLQIFTCGGREVGVRGKDGVLPRPDGSILSGHTVFRPEVNLSLAYTLYEMNILLISVTC